MLIEVFLLVVAAQLRVCLTQDAADLSSSFHRSFHDKGDDDDDDDDDHLVLTNGAIIGICLCIGLPLMMIAAFCLYSKCSTSKTVTPEPEVDSSAAAPPKPPFVLQPQPPPYPGSGSLPSYDEVVGQDVNTYWRSQGTSGADPDDVTSS